jgi:hypothetical protein
MKQLLHIEHKVLNVFGRVIRPANWIIFGSGVLLAIAAPFIYALLDQDALTSLILWVQGVQLMVEGYGEVKGDEDVEAK